MDKLEIWDEAKLKLQFNGRIFVNTQDEHYKFWTIEVIDKSSYRSYWGRIGKTIQSQTISGIQQDIDRKIREKLRKGYREL